MNKHRLILSTTLASCLLTGSLALAATEVSIPADSRTRLDLTLYQDNLALVQETRKIPALPENTPILLQEVSPQLHAQTLQLSGAGQILEQNLERERLSLGRLLEAKIGKSLSLARFNPVTGKETRTRVRLLRVEGQTALVENGHGEIESLPLHQGQWRLILQPESPRLPLQPRLSFRTRGTSAPAEARISYLTQGLSWQMDYLLTLDSDGRKLNLEGLATLTNHSGLSWPDARIKLLAGQVNQPDRQVLMAPAMRALSTEMKSDSVETGAVQDYHLYTLPGRYTLKNQQQKQVPLIPRTELPAEIHYTYSLQVSTRQQIPSRLDQAVTELHFSAPASAEQRLPLPGGQARVFRPDTDGQLQFVGGARIPATAAGEAVRLVTGKAFDLGIEQVQTGFRKVFEGYEVKYRVSVRNRAEEDKTLDLSARFPLPFKLNESSIAATETSAGSAKWTLDVAAESERVLTFTATLTTP